MIQIVCQVILVVELVLFLLIGFYVDAHGTIPAKGNGFEGNLQTLFWAVLQAFILYGAGAFSTFFGS